MKKNNRKVPSGSKKSVKSKVVIFLGDSAVGKTETIERVFGLQRISGGTNNGVDEYKWQSSDGQNVLILDFDKEQIDFCLYRFFLADNICCVVTVSNKNGESRVTGQARRWLKEIQRFAPKSNVVLAVNRWDGTKDTVINEEKLFEEFGLGSAKIIRYTAKANKEEGIDKLKNLIEDSVKDVSTLCPDKISNWKKQNEVARIIASVTKEEYEKVKDENDSSNKLIDFATFCPIYKEILNSKFSNYTNTEISGILKVIEERRLLFKIINDNQELAFMPVVFSDVVPAGSRPDKFIHFLQCKVKYNHSSEYVFHRFWSNLKTRFVHNTIGRKVFLCHEDLERPIDVVFEICEDDDVLSIDFFYERDGSYSDYWDCGCKCLAGYLKTLREINDILELKPAIWIYSNNRRVMDFAKDDSVYQVLAQNRSTIRCARVEGTVVSEEVLELKPEYCFLSPHFSYVNPASKARMFVISSTDNVNQQSFFDTVKKEILDKPWENQDDNKNSVLRWLVTAVVTGVVFPLILEVLKGIFLKK